MIVQFCFTSEEARNVYNALSPKYENPLASGFDLRAVSFDASFDQFGAIHNVEKREDMNPPSVISYTLFSQRRILVKTGIRIAIDNSSLTELQIRSRSGMTLKQGLIVLNGIGTIDMDYRGELGVILYNSSIDKQVINIGDRIAQGVFNPLCQADFQEISLEAFNTLDTKRGNGGFGSTGK